MTDTNPLGARPRDGPKLSVGENHGKRLNALGLTSNTGKTGSFRSCSGTALASPGRCQGPRLHRNPCGTTATCARGQGFTRPESCHVGTAFAFRSASDSPQPWRRRLTPPAPAPGTSPARAGVITGPIAQIFPRMRSTSSASNALSDCVRTLPRLPMLKSSAATDWSSGASTTVTTS
jgi:hypothetical protein